MFFIFMNVRDAQRCQRKYLEMKDWSKFHVVKTTMRRESQVWRFRDSKVHITDMFGCMANIGTLHLSSKCLGRGRTNWLGGAPNHLQKVGGGGILVALLTCGLRTCTATNAHVAGLLSCSPQANIRIARIACYGLTIRLLLQVVNWLKQVDSSLFIHEVDASCFNNLQEVYHCIKFDFHKLDATK